MRQIAWRGRNQSCHAKLRATRVAGGAPAEISDTPKDGRYHL